MCTDSSSLSSPSLFPSTFRLSANATELTWTLPTEGLVQNKEYKISYKVRPEKGVESGSTVSIPVSLDGPGFGLDEMGRNGTNPRAVFHG